MASGASSSTSSSRRRGPRGPRLLLLPAPLLLLVGACSKPSPFAGRWEGSFVEGDVHVGVALEFKGDPLEGTFTLLTDPGHEVKKGQVFGLLDVRAEGERLTFTLAITGKVDGDASLWDLRLSGDRLLGTARENREGRKPFAVELRRT